jgi:hypothetical protein
MTQRATFTSCLAHRSCPTYNSSTSRQAPSRRVSSGQAHEPARRPKPDILRTRLTPAQTAGPQAPFGLLGDPEVVGSPLGRPTGEARG